MLVVFLEFSWCVWIFWHYIILHFCCDLYFISIRRILLHNVNNLRLSILNLWYSLVFFNTLFDVLNNCNELVCILSDLSYVTHWNLMIRVCQTRKQTVSRFDWIFRIIKILFLIDWYLWTSFLWNLCELQLLHFLHLFDSHCIQVNFSGILVTWHLWLLVKSWQFVAHLDFSLRSQNFFLLCHLGLKCIFYLELIVRYFSTRRVRWNSTFTNISYRRLLFELIVRETVCSLILSLVGYRWL